MKFDVCIKAGTCGHSDYDNCDLAIKTNIETNQLPTKNDILILDKYKKYLVTQVCRSFQNHGEFNTVYVIKY